MERIPLQSKENEKEGKCMISGRSKWKAKDVPCSAGDLPVQILPAYLHGILSDQLDQPSMKMVVHRCDLRIHDTLEITKSNKAPVRGLPIDRMLGMCCCLLAKKHSCPEVLNNIDKRGTESHSIRGFG